MGAWTGMSWLRIGYKCGNELPGSINAGNFLTSRKTVSFSKRPVLHGVS
jgi:hypothetical protein